MNNHQSAVTAQAHRVLETAITALRQTTALRAQVQESASATIVEVEVGRHKHHFVAAVRTVDRFETPAMVTSRLTHSGQRPLLVAPYITREIAARCRDLHLSFIDTAGNAYLEAPGLLIYVVGQPRPSELKQDRFRALNPAGLQITFALLCRPELIRASYREIAAAARVSLGAVGPVMNDLKARGFLRLTTGQERDVIDPERMLQEWVTHYPTTLRPKLNPRRFQADPDRLFQIDLKRHNAYWGGEVAAEMLTHFLKPAHFTIYVREPIAKLAAASRMRADHTGNVETLDTFWDFETSFDDVSVVPPVLAYADLLATNDGRNSEAAKLIYEQRIEPTFRHAN